MNRVIVLLAVSLATALAQPSQSEKAEKLLQECTAPGETAKLLCAAYINGFMDGIAMQSINNRRYICWPKDGLSAFQAVRIVVKWLEDHPKNLNKSGRSEVMLALEDAFPCKE